MAEMAKARVAKQEEIARLVRLRKQRNEELLQAGILILIFLVLLPAIVGGIGYMVINR
jgi:nitrate reductase NapE component